MIKRLKEWLKPRLVYFLSRNLNLGFKPCPTITSQEIRVQFDGEQFVFRSDFRTPLYETINEVLDYDCYQLAKVPFTTASDALVVDIGANIGVSAVALARRTAGRVYAFEPIADNYVRLQANLAANHIANVECRRAAVGQKKGRMTMAINPEESVSPYMAGPGHPAIPAGFQTEEVEVIGINNLLEEFGARPIDLIKMDCEGAEYELIDALRLADHRRVRAITMEVHDLDRARNCRGMESALRELGFDVHYKPELLGRPVLHHLLALRT